jgi:hypothetical protein
MYAPVPHHHGPVHHPRGAHHNLPSNGQVQHHPHAEVHEAPPGSGKAALAGLVLAVGLGSGPVAGPIILAGGAVVGAGWLIRRVRSKSGTVGPPA